jgi:hypoxanthine phosphoribosyltransferase
VDKIYLSAQQLLEDSFRLAAKIKASGFRPDLILGVWRGGTPVAIAVHEYFDVKGVKADHFPIRTVSYFGINQQADDVQVFGLELLADQLAAAQSLLVIDDVFDSGRSLRAIRRELQRQHGDNLPADTRIACPWYKPSLSRVNFEPDYYLHSTDKWLVFPHELSGLTADEITAGKSALISELINAGD